MYIQYTVYVLKHLDLIVKTACKCSVLGTGSNNWSRSARTCTPQRKCTFFANTEEQTQFSGVLCSDQWTMYKTCPLLSCSVLRRQLYPSAPYAFFGKGDTDSVCWAHLSPLDLNFVLEHELHFLLPQLSIKRHHDFQPGPIRPGFEHLTSVLLAAASWQLETWYCMDK